MSFVRNRIGSYLEQQILSANPLEIVNLSYQTAIRGVRDARTALGNRDIAGRVKGVRLAHAVLSELNSTLDFTAGGELARELARLYDYMMRRLNEANSQQSDAPLADVLSVLCTLAEAWDQLAKSEGPKSAPASQTVRPWETADLYAEESSYSLSF